MAGDKQSDLRFEDPPRGFAILRESEIESEIDPERGRPDRWVARGIVNGRSVIRTGLVSHAAACRSAWLVVDDLIARGEPVQPGNVLEADAVVANALARRHAARREREADRAEVTMRDRYCVERDTWANMRAQLLAQLLADAGSIRKLAREIGVPRSTVGAWVAAAKQDGSWPR